MKYRLELQDEAGRVVAFRIFELRFNEFRSEEFLVSRKAVELFRDAAHGLGKWSKPKKEGEK